MTSKLRRGTRQLPLSDADYDAGAVHFLAHNERQTVILRFAVDFANGRAHTLLEESGLTRQSNEHTEAEQEHFTRYFHSVVGNSRVELCIPLPCEAIIPVNIIPRAPEEAVAEAVAAFRHAKNGDNANPR